MSSGTSSDWYYLLQNNPKRTSQSTVIQSGIWTGRPRTLNTLVWMMRWDKDKPLSQILQLHWRQSWPASLQTLLQFQLVLLQEQLGLEAHSRSCDEIHLMQLFIEHKRTCGRWAIYKRIVLAKKARSTRQILYAVYAHRMRWVYAESRCPKL